jgi:hypothetical protein
MSRPPVELILDIVTLLVATSASTCDDDDDLPAVPPRPAHCPRCHTGMARDWVRCPICPAL